jgi:adenylate kinase family enzyme
MLAERLGVPHIELDSLFHQPGWQPLPRERFRDEVRSRTAEDSWVVDGNYSAVQDIVWSRADTVVWIDLSRRRVMRQLTVRTLRRLILREELWNGNREPWSNLFRFDPEKSILAWAWTSHRRYRQRYSAAARDPANAHLRFVTVRRPRDVDELVTTASSTGSNPSRSQR